VNLISNGDGNNSPNDTHLDELIRAIIELEHHDVNIIRRNRYIKGMPKAVFLVMEVRS